MKVHVLILLMFFSGWVGAGTLEKAGSIKHIVLVKLKGSEDVGRFMALSKRLVKLPGVKRYSIGPTLPKEDDQSDGFDIGVVVTLENRQALFDYLRHPQHKKIIEKMRPLVESIEVHDFITR